MNALKCNICLTKLIQNGGNWDNDPKHRNALNSMYCCGYVFHSRCLDRMENEAKEDLRKG